MFSRSLFKLLHLQSTNNTYNNRNHINSFDTKKKTEKHKTTYTTNIISLFSSRNLRYIYSRSGRGLDIQYFCLFYFIYVRSFSIVCSVYFCCCLCFRLVYLSVCVYNRTHTYKHITTNTQKKLREQQNNTTNQQQT